MLNYIICDKEKESVTKYAKEIENFMMAYDIDYKITIFSDYNEEWTNFIHKENGFKIYIISLINREKKSLKAIYEIREKEDDWLSMIITLGKNNEGKDIIEKRLLILDYINKTENCITRFHNDLKICLKNYDNKHKKLRYTYKNTIYNLEFRHIIYIEKELDTKRCLIKTNYDTYYINGSINKVLSLLDNRFIKSYRSLIINLEQVESYNLKNNTITFKNKSTITNISREKKKEIIKYLRGLSN